MVRKALLAAVAVLLSTATPQQQLAACMAVTVFAAIAHAWMRPYAVDSLNWLELGTQATATLTILVGLFLLAGSDRASALGSTLAVLGANVLVIAAALALVILALRDLASGSVGSFRLQRNNSVALVHTHDHEDDESDQPKDDPNLKGQSEPEAQADSPVPMLRSRRRIDGDVVAAAGGASSPPSTTDSPTALLVDTGALADTPDAFQAVNPMPHLRRRDSPAAMRPVSGHNGHMLPTGPPKRPTARVTSGGSLAFNADNVCVGVVTAAASPDDHDGSRADAEPVAELDGLAGPGPGELEGRAEPASSAAGVTRNFDTVHEADAVAGSDVV
jgi:hypothetical protein